MTALFEHSPWVEARADARPSSGDRYADLMTVVHDATPAEQLALIRAHPELAVHVVECLHDVLELVFPRNARALLAELCPPLRRPEQLGDHRGRVRWITGVQEDAAARSERGQATRARHRDHRDAARHRLKSGDPKRLHLRGDEKHIEAIEPCRNILLPADEGKHVSDALPFGSRFETSISFAWAISAMRTPWRRAIDASVWPRATV